jgi:oxygen-independent coproporphyrinogen-3 oxidase
MSTGIPEFDADLIRRFDRNGPRYTSYPTADRFVESFGDDAYRTWAARRNTGGVARPLALYIHLPFCRDVCYYCACNKIVTRDAGKAARYLDYLGREIELQAALFCDDARVTQMHWGGGTPTYYDTGQLKALFERLAGVFEFSPNGEYSIEVDPRTVDAGSIRALREIGFNRVSFGVQDFDPTSIPSTRISSTACPGRRWRAAARRSIGCWRCDRTALRSTTTRIFQRCSSRSGAFRRMICPRPRRG